MVFLKVTVVIGCKIFSLIKERDPCVISLLKDWEQSGTGIQRPFPFCENSIYVGNSGKGNTDPVDFTTEHAVFW